MFRTIRFLVCAVVVDTINDVVGCIVRGCGLGFVAPNIVSFVYASLVTIVLAVGLFLLVGRFRGRRVGGNHSVADTQVVSHVVGVAVVIILILLCNRRFNVDLSNLLAFNNVNNLTINVTNGSVLDGFFSKVVLCFSHPFDVNS